MHIQGRVLVIGPSDDIVLSGITGYWVDDDYGTADTVVESGSRRRRIKGTQAYTLLHHHFAGTTQDHYENLLQGSEQAEQKALEAFAANLDRIESVINDRDIMEAL